MLDSIWGLRGLRGRFTWDGNDYVIPAAGTVTLAVPDASRIAIVFSMVGGAADVSILADGKRGMRRVAMLYSASRTPTPFVYRDYGAAVSGGWQAQGAPGVTIVTFEVFLDDASAADPDDTIVYEESNDDDAPRSDLFLGRPNAGRVVGNFIRPLRG